MELPERWWLPAAGGLLAGGVAAVVLSRTSASKSLLSGAVPPSATAQKALLAGLPPPPIGAQVVPKANTGGTTWLSDRYASLQRQGITGDQAHAIVAMWAVETAAGAGEYCFNVGNYTAVSGVALCYYVKPNGCTVGNCPVWWIAYTSLDAGVQDWISRVSTTWPTAWSELQANPLQSTWVSSMSSYYGGGSSYVPAWQARLASTAAPA